MKIQRQGPDPKPVPASPRLLLNIFGAKVTSSFQFQAGCGILSHLISEGLAEEDGEGVDLKPLNVLFIRELLSWVGRDEGGGGWGDIGGWGCCG